MRLYRTQITQNEEVKTQEKRDYMEEGKKVRQKMETEKQTLEKIKQKKLEQLKSLGISEKYAAELARKKVQ